MTEILQLIKGGGMETSWLESPELTHRADTHFNVVTLCTYVYTSCLCVIFRSFLSKSFNIVILF